LLEEETWVEEIHSKDSNHTHDSIQNDERGLVLHDRITPSASHFSDSVDTANGNSCVCGDERNKKTLEAPRVAQIS
jgi:hypothetical protein